MRILCIDDNVILLKMYKDILKNHVQPDDEIITAIDAEQGIAILHKKCIDLVITDLSMPVQSGIDVLREAKKINQSIEVIVVTGYGTIDSAVEAMRLGARDYLTKPFTAGMLTEKIQNIREFISRGNEIEEYRFAKETINENAIKTVAEMKVTLDTYINLIHDINKITTDTINSDKKIEKILNHINTIEKKL